VNLKPIIVAGSLGLAALLAGACSAGDTIVNSQPGAASGISVSGTGRAVGAPDVATLQIGIDLERPTVAAAREAAAAAQKGVVDSLKANGVEDKDVQTVQFTISPVYDSRSGTQTLRGYRISNVVRADVRKIDQAGKVIDDAVAAGGNGVVVRGISFSIDDPTELREAAREEAVNDARSKAEQLASAAGVKVGKPISISETGAIPYPVYAGEAAARTLDTATPIEAGELEIVVQVSVLFALD
jgi:uncharacterized protein YggE